MKSSLIAAAAWHETNVCQTEHRIQFNKTVFFSDPMVLLKVVVEKNETPTRRERIGCGCFFLGEQVQIKKTGKTSWNKENI